mmetsp:Transcript_5795/g.8889  ORF Transcript_5795/g.8889 Transcript_5795/m.8889 type:complete len:216 (-) Transcript_5795:4958-5605(-)
MDVFGTAPTLGGTPSGTGVSSSLFQQLQADVRKLQVDLANLLADKDAQIVQLGALGFKNTSDALAYVKSTPGAEKFDLLTDVSEFCMLMQKEIHGERKFIKLLKSLSDINLKSIREAMSVDAFSNPIPPLFHDPEQGIPTKEAPVFLRYTTYKQWEDHLELLKIMIITDQTSLETSINSEVPASSPAHAIFLLSVSTTVAHLTGFIGFVDNSVKW